MDGQRASNTLKQSNPEESRLLWKSTPPRIIPHHLTGREISHTRVRCWSRTLYQESDPNLNSPKVTYWDLTERSTLVIANCLIGHGSHGNGPHDFLHYPTWNECHVHKKYFTPHMHHTIYWGTQQITLLLCFIYSKVVQYRAKILHSFLLVLAFVACFGRSDFLWTFFYAFGWAFSFFWLLCFLLLLVSASCNVQATAMKLYHSKKLKL